MDDFVLVRQTQTDRHTPYLQVLLRLVFLDLLHEVVGPGVPVQVQTLAGFNEEAAHGLL